MLRALSSRLILLILLVLAGACQPAPAPLSHVALWAISRNGVAQGWIIGTIHALPPGTAWRRPEIDAAMAAADRLVLEIGEPLDPTIAGAALARRAGAPDLPPPSARLAGADARALDAAYRRLGVDDRRFAGEKSWAVALQLSALAMTKAGADAADGVEPQVRAAMAGKPVIGLETIDGQFAVFDRLDPAAQTHLLGEVAHEAADDRHDDADTLTLWLRGDDLGLAKEAQSDFLADPALRAPLLTARTRAWAGQVDALLRHGAHPFIAVGAAHVLGAEGLPALLQARGWTVRRIA